MHCGNAITACARWTPEAWGTVRGVCEGGCRCGGACAGAGTAHGCAGSTAGHKRNSRTEWSREHEARVWDPSSFTSTSAGCPPRGRHRSRVTAAQWPREGGTTNSRRQVHSGAASPEGGCWGGGEHPCHSSTCPDSRPTAVVHVRDPAGGRVGSTATAVTAWGNVATVDSWTKARKRERRLQQQQQQQQLRHTKQQCSR
jgi:hypothetical protein